MNAKYFFLAICSVFVCGAIYGMNAKNPDYLERFMENPKLFGSLKDYVPSMVAKNRKLGSFPIQKLHGEARAATPEQSSIELNDRGWHCCIQRGGRYYIGKIIRYREYSVLWQLQGNSETGEYGIFTRKGDRSLLERVIKDAMEETRK